MDPVLAPRAHRSYNPSVLGAQARSGPTADDIPASRRLRAVPDVGTDDAAGGATDRQVRVLIVDDHELVRRGLREVFGAAEAVTLVGEAATGEAALALLDEHPVDVVVLDIRLPDVDGIELCRDILEKYSVECLMLTSYDAEEAMFAAVAAGASGFLAKDVTGAELVDTVNRVAQGESLLDSMVSKEMLDRISEGVADRRRLELLTDQERRIFDLVAEGQTNREIAAQMFLAEKTVRNYVSNVLSKLALKRRAEVAAFAARIAWRQGPR
jgi:two-component system, NarL family, response regulator DevR